jgi:hypothetical protein
MEIWHWTLLLKPLALFVFFAFIGLLEWLILKLIPEGKLKRLLTKKIN